MRLNRHTIRGHLQIPAIALLGATRPARYLGLLDDLDLDELETPIRYKRNRKMSIQNPRSVNSYPRRPDLPSELSKYPDSQKGGPVLVDDIDTEDHFRKELEDGAIMSGRTPQAAEEYAKRVTAATKASYEGYRNRAADGVVRLPGSR